MKKREWLQFKYIFFVLLILLSIGASGFFVKYYTGKGVENVINDKSVERTYIPLESGATFTQDFITDAQLITGVALHFDMGSDISKGDAIFISIFDEQGNLVAALESSTTTLNDQTTRRKFSFPTSFSNPGGKLTITVQFTEVSLNDKIGIRMAGDNLDVGLLELKHDIFYNLLVLFMVLFVLMVAIVYYLLFLRKGGTALEYVYLPCGIALGIIFTLMLPMGATPDETLHMYKAYDISNEVLGIDHNEKYEFKMREDDDKYIFRINDFSREYIDEYYDGLFEPVHNADYIMTEKVGIWEHYIYYLPAVLGMLIGKITGLNLILTIVIARLINLAIFITATFFAIRFMPFAKGLVFAWAILPVNLQQTMSLSRDSMMLSLSVIIISLTLNLAYSDSGFESNNKKAKRIKAIVLAIACLILLPLKNFACITISAFPFLLALRPLCEKFSKLCEKYGKKRVVITAIIGFVIGIVLFVIVGLLGIIFLVAESDRISEVIANPGGFVSIFINTLWIQMNNYIYGMFGQQLGWMNILLPEYMVLPFMLSMVGFAFTDSKNGVKLLNVERIWMWLVFFGIVFLAILGMYIFWTGGAATFVVGVQGRYFVPALIVLILSFRSSLINIDKKAESYMIMFLVFWQIVIGYGIVGIIG